MASHNSFALPEISPKSCLKYELEECWCSRSKSRRSSRVNCYSHSPYKNHINLVKEKIIMIIIQNKMLSFLELAIGPLGQFKVFSVCISFVLLEALKRNYYTSSNIQQCHVSYKRRSQMDTSLASRLLARLAGNLADSVCWNEINPDPCSPPSEQHYPF